MEKRAQERQFGWEGDQFNSRLKTFVSTRQCSSRSCHVRMQNYSQARNLNFFVCVFSRRQVAQTISAEVLKLHENDHFLNHAVLVTVEGHLLLCWTDCKFFF